MQAANYCQHNQSICYWNFTCWVYRLFRYPSIT